MKNRLKYPFILILLVILAYIGYNSISKNEYIAKGYAAAVISEQWNKLIANSVNSKEINIFVDGFVMKLENENLYMNDSMDIMMPTNIIRDVFDCAINIYDEDRILLEKGDIAVELFMNASKMVVNGSEYAIKGTPLKKAESIYIPMSAIVDGFGYDYTWNSMENAGYLGNKEFLVDLPERYDYREKGKAGVVKNQGYLGTCWACASLTALETTVKPEWNSEFSVDHMSMNNSFNLTQYDGGEYSMAVAYLTAWQGPVLEKDDPYGDGLTDSKLEPVAHVQEVQILEPNNIKEIKSMVYKYGGVQSSLYMSLLDSNSTSQHYNNETNAYCYIGEEKPNHDVVIIGWDDHYPKENFNANIEMNGAFICQNSWGREFGDKGIIYISYYDTNIGMNNVAYTRVDDTDNYDNIYQTDLCGYRGILGYEKEYAYFANAYTAEKDEYLAAASFYATDKDTSYSVYVCENFTDADSLANKKQVATGSFENAGYYTVDFDNLVEVKKGQKYAIIVYINTPNSKRPVAVELARDFASINVDLSNGEGYISINGNKWENVEEEQQCNICLKCFSIDK